MTTTPHPDAKVLFRVPNEDGTASVETLWATNLGGDNYRLENSPFWVYGVSWEDIVFAPHSEIEGHPTFQAIVEKSGNRTIRVVFDPPIENGYKSNQLLRGLVGLGCSYEGANDMYVSVNIPPSVEIDLVRQYLIEQGATWEHADPTYEALFPQDA